MQRLFRPIDAAILAYFRIAFTVLMLWEFGRFLASGRVARNWIEPAFHFTYYGFDWVRPLPGHGLYVLVSISMLAAVGLLLGFCYRLAAILLALGLTYLFLIEQAEYLNLLNR